MFHVHSDPYHHYNWHCIHYPCLILLGPTLSIMSLSLLYFPPFLALENTKITSHMLWIKIQWHCIQLLRNINYKCLTQWQFEEKEVDTKMFLGYQVIPLSSWLHIPSL